MAGQVVHAGIPADGTAHVTRIDRRTGGAVTGVDPHRDEFGLWPSNPSAT